MSFPAAHCEVSSCRRLVRALHAIACVSHKRISSSHRGGVKGRCITCGSENCESYYKLHAKLRRNTGDRTSAELPCQEATSTRDSSPLARHSLLRQFGTGQLGIEPDRVTTPCGTQLPNLPRGSIQEETRAEVSLLCSA